MRANCHRFLVLLAVFAGVFSTPAPAAGFKLGIVPAGNKALISWPAAATNYVLQSTLNLAAPSWLTITNPAPVVFNNTNTVTYTNNSLTRFFRLFLNTNLASGVRLNIARSGNTFLITWPVAATNYVLQSTPNLAAPSWLTLTNPPTVVINNTNTVTYTNDSLTRFFRLYLNTNTFNPFAGMVLIPAGTFTMGDVTDTNINGDAAPMSVTVSAFYMDSNLVSAAQWQSVYSLAISAGYGFDNGGAGKAANHPVQTVNWYDTVKWCNARSQQAGLTAVYYTDAGLTLAYTNGDVDAVFVNWSANGFRLPTEAEWEKAARGGVSGRRFPWGNTISRANANYYGQYNGDFYDLAPLGYNSAFYTPPQQPYTSPVGYFAPNGYGLFDLAGNVMEWCWDWYGKPYSGGTDPHGPSLGSNRVLRGGDWTDDASLARCADRNNFVYSFISPNPGVQNNQIGFRCVRAR
jgi:formylglycine-generating enzyme required for sulfatase activity